MKRLTFVALVLCTAFLTGQARQARLTTPDNRNDDAATTEVEYRSNNGIEVHLDEDEFNPVGTCTGSTTPYQCCTAVDTGPSCDGDNDWTLYDGSNNVLMSVGEDGVALLGTNDIVRGSGSTTWGPAFWATTTAGTTVCSNQGLTCVNAWNLGVGAANCASTANPRVVYCQ